MGMKPDGTLWGEDVKPADPPPPPPPPPQPTIVSEKTVRRVEMKWDYKTATYTYVLGEAQEEEWSDGRIVHYHHGTYGRENGYRQIAEGDREWAQRNAGHYNIKIVRIKD